MLHSLLLGVAVIFTADPPAPWETVVRIHAGNTIRSGVIIQSDERSSVALTAGHNWRGLGRNVEVHLFDGVIHGNKPAQVRYTGRCAGEVVLVEEEDDYAYVRFYPGRVMPVSPIATQWNPQLGEELIAIGSSEGADPTAWSTNVESIERTLVQCTHMPKMGRSGGGLFNLQWELVGICVGQIPELKRGAYLRIKPTASRR